MIEILKKFGFLTPYLTLCMIASSIIANIFLTIQPFIFVLIYSLFNNSISEKAKQDGVAEIVNNQNFFDLERLILSLKNFFEMNSTEYSDTEKLYFLIAIFVIIVFCASLFRFIGSTFVEVIEANTRLRIRILLKNKILDHDLLDYKKIQSGYFQSVFIKDTEDVAITSGRFLSAIFIHGSQLAICIIFLASTNLFLFSILLFFFSLHFLYNRILNIPILTSNKNMYQFTGKMAAKIIDYFNNFKILKILQGKDFHTSVNNSFFKNKNFELKAKILNALQNPSRVFIDNILIISVIGIIFYFILNKAINVETAILFLFFSKYSSGPVSGLATSLLWGKAIKGAYQRVKSIFNYNSKIKSGERNNIEFTRCIEFKNICFGYGESVLIQNISFVIEKNSYNLVVGKNGSGKSTLLDLLTRLVEPKEGEILIDGVNIKDFDTKTYRSIFSYISQDGYLIDGTVKENILLGSKLEFNNKKTEDLIYTTLEAVDGLFVYKLDEGLQSDVGEGGSFLSGGQKQKICIARALLNQSQVIIFDESTSGFDQASKEKFSSLLEKLVLTKTILQVDHNKIPAENENLIHLNPLVEK